MDGYTASDQQKAYWSFANEGDRISPAVFDGLEAKSLETYRKGDRWHGIVKINPGKVKRGTQVLSAIRKWNKSSCKPIKLLKMEGQEHHIVPLQERQGRELMVNSIGKDLANMKTTNCDYEFYTYTLSNSAQTAGEKKLVDMETAHNLATVKLKNEMQREIDARDNAHNIAIRDLATAYNAAMRDFENAHNIERIRDRMMLETKTEMCVKLEDQVKELGGVKMNDMQVKIATMEVEASRLREENASLTVEVGQLKLKIEGLESDKKQLTLDTSEVKQLVKKHKKLETLFEDQKKTLTSKETRFEEEKADIQRRLDSMRNDLKKSEAKVKEYEKMIADSMTT